MCATPKPTLTVSHGPLQAADTGGSAKPGATNAAVDVAAASESAATEQAYEWLQCVDPSILNVAGPRASQDPAIYRTVVELLRAALAQLAG